MTDQTKRAEETARHLFMSIEDTEDSYFRDVERIMAYGQAEYQRGVEAMRNAAVKKATEIMGEGSPYIGFTRDSMYSIAVRLLSKSEEVK